jgi:hypothetical protein
MPTKREREYYRMGFRDGGRQALGGQRWADEEEVIRFPREEPSPYVSPSQIASRKLLRPKRKLSAWNKYVKANSKKPRFRYRNGKLNLKKMAIAFRKTPAGRKKRR